MELSDEVRAVVFRLLDRFALEADADPGNGEPGAACGTRLQGFALSPRNDAGQLARHADDLQHLDAVGL